MKAGALATQGGGLWHRSLAVAAFSGLVLWVLSTHKPPIYDEIEYLQLAERLTTATSLRTWLLDNDLGPAGPVHALLHHSLSGLTGYLPSPWFRLPNLVFLCLVAWLLKDCLELLGHKQGGLLAASVLVVPMTWILCGMALTEMPAMFGITAAIWGALRLGRHPGAGARSERLSYFALMTGLMIALCGRQVYLVTVPALFLFASGGKQKKRHLLLALLVGCLPLGYLVWHWGGLVPPKLAWVSGGGLKLEHGLLALGYLGLSTLLLAPGHLLRNLPWGFAVGLPLVGLNLHFSWVQFTTLDSLQSLLGLPKLGQGIGWALAPAFLLIASTYLVGLLRETLNQPERVQLGLGWGIISLSGSCATITHLFSSRYVGMALPFLILSLAPQLRFTRLSVLSWLLGMATGFAALYSYYKVW